MRDAAFYYLLTNKTAYADVVRKELLAQMAEPATNFANTARWCLGESGDSGPAFATSEWILRMLFSYDYIKNTLSANDKTTMNTWFKNAAYYIRSNYDIAIDKRFVNRQAGNFTLTDYGKQMESFEGESLYYGGPKARSLAKTFNNRACSMAYCAGVVGIFLNDATLKNSAKEFFKEWMTYGVFPDGLIADMHRRSSTLVDKGFAYCHTSMGTMNALADAFARSGRCLPVRIRHNGRYHIRYFGYQRHQCAYGRTTQVALESSVLPE